MCGAINTLVERLQLAARQPKLWAFPFLLGAAVAAYGQKYGGEYEIANPPASKPGQLARDKISEFDALRDASIGWNSSETVLLERALFVKSIIANKGSKAPKAETYQRYNYVVKNNEIRVAVWTTGGAVRKVCRRAPVSARAYLATRTEKGTMVNFFPEVTDLPNSKDLGEVPGACTSTTSAGKTTGVLDGHSKHFMLAQGDDKNKLVRLGAYKSGVSGNTWETAKVDYAGEIIVDVKHCIYIINQGSGTYRPKGGQDFAYLLAVAELFRDRVLTPPLAVWDTQTPLLVPTTQVPTKSTDLSLDCGNGSSETSTDSKAAHGS